MKGHRRFASGRVWFILGWLGKLYSAAHSKAKVRARCQGLVRSCHVYRSTSDRHGEHYGAAYANGFTDIMIGGAVLPSLLHQDPRYFYQGTGKTNLAFSAP
jgi:hypothetical protein